MLQTIKTSDLVSTIQGMRVPLADHSKPLLEDYVVTAIDFMLSFMSNIHMICSLFLVSTEYQFIMLVSGHFDESFLKFL